MAFPETRHTLIKRLAQGGQAADWHEFLSDYWGPVCRFAQRRGAMSATDAEDVAAQTLEAVIRNSLLSRWSENRSAKLRTLICTVVRNVISNRARVASGRERLAREHGGSLNRYEASSPEDVPEVAAEQADAFYAAWAEDIVQTAVEQLLAEYNRAGRGDHFRVLFGRICEQLSSAEIADALSMSPSAVDGCYRQARERLGEKLREVLREQVRRYSAPESAREELEQEWTRLGEYLRTHGGLEEAVRASYAAFAPERAGGWMTKVVIDRSTADTGASAGS